MSLEQSIQNLADAINNLAKSQQGANVARAVAEPAVLVVEKPKAEPHPDDAKPKVEKAKPAAAAEKPVEKAPEPVKTEEPKAVEGEVIAADEKTEEEIRQEAFGAPDGYIYKPFMALPYAQKEIIAEQFGGLDGKTAKKRISLVPFDQIPALKAAVEAALAEVQG